MTDKTINLSAIPLEELNLSPLFITPEMITPILFPDQPQWQGRRILYIREVGEPQMIGELSKKFPGAQIEEIDITSITSLNIDAEPQERYHYIIAAALRNLPARMKIQPIIPWLVTRLLPGGTAAVAVPGYSGYYSLAMLHRILVKLIGACDSHSCTSPEDRKKQSKQNSITNRIVKSIIASLPDNHPIYHRQHFINLLLRGNQKALNQILQLDEENIYSVSRLLDAIEGGKGCLKDWLIPGFYHPSRYSYHQTKREELDSLKEPGKWLIAESLNAWPPEHYFFLGRKEDLIFRIPWDSADIYHWRPLSLPLYSQAKIIDSKKKGNKTQLNPNQYEPIPLLKGFEPLELTPWQTQLLKNATGHTTLNHLMVGSQTPSEIDLKEFILKGIDTRLLILLPPL